MHRAHGYAMAALLVTIAVMSVMMSVAMPTWRVLVQREKEAELVFRGEQYARAIELFQRKYAGAHPPSLDVLIEQRFLRKKYKDPMVEDGEFRLLYQNRATPSVPGQPSEGSAPPQPGETGQSGAGASPPPQRPSFGASSSGSQGLGPIGGEVGPQGGIVGVTSKSTKDSLRLYNGRSKYSEWEFVYAPTTNQAGEQTSPVPGQVPGQTRPGDGRTPTGGSPGFPSPGFPSLGRPPGGSPGSPR